MSKEELRQLIHDMLMSGEKKSAVIAKIIQLKGCGTSQAYRDFENYLKDPAFMDKRGDIKESVKKSLYLLYMAAAGKGQGRAAVEVLDRLLIVCPWIKDEEEIKKDTEINLIIKEWSHEDKE